MTKSVVTPIANHAAAIGGRSFREGMSRVAAAVHVVTTAGHAGQAGLTATAVASVTDDPPTLLVCINSASRSYRFLEENGVFAVNALGAGDRRIAEIFSGMSDVAWEKRFDFGDWGTAITGAPILHNALVSFDCRIRQISVIASHKVVYGEVVDVRWAGEGEALAYYRRRYRDL